MRNPSAEPLHPGAADRALVRRMLAGEEAAFDQFCDAHIPGLYRFALARLDRDADRALDTVQGTLCKAIANLAAYRGEAPLASWLFTICRHEIDALYRRQRRSPIRPLAGEQELVAALDSLAASLEAPDDGLVRRELAELVHSTLDRLPRHYGDALEWKYIEGLAVNEIAVRLGLGPKAAESLLTRARWAFRDAWIALTGGSCGAASQPPMTPARRSPQP